ncbi:hypothetical protein ACRQ1B_28315 [Rhizobium panacihumi]|uniref:hypothetical protein n=1 Tax=Rhizobium panacihumi TaxID=2008450 RepID=UPI003D7932D3
MVYQRATLERAEETHRVSAEIMAAEKRARLEKTERLRQARLAAVAEEADRPL